MPKFTPQFHTPSSLNPSLISYPATAKYFTAATK